MASSNDDKITMPTPPSSRKNRPLRRKTSHSVIERRRREKINEGLINLQNLVPACRDELSELFLSKANANKRNAKRPKEEIEKEVEDLVEQKIKTSMVLEKLCIISHTVDYVRELQASIVAYRELCRCSPPLNGIQMQSKFTNSHQEAHLFGRSGLEELDQNPPIQIEQSSPELEGQKCESCRVNRAKRRRHWGSNNPLELAKADSGSHSSSSRKRLDNHPVLGGLSQRPKRKAAPALDSMREESTSVTGSIEDANAADEIDEMVDDNDDSSDEAASELALDDWEERHGCKTHLQKSISDVENPINLSKPLTFLRKRSATDSHNVGLLNGERNKDKMAFTDRSGALYQSNGESKCDDCFDDAKGSSGLHIGPQNLLHAKRRAASPSDRMLHKRTKTSDDRLTFLAEIVTQR